jgi:isocitrate dehydrogenase
MHRSPGFMTSNLIGQRKDGVMIKEFEASHGTVADLWEAHLRGEATSLNPLGMVEALIGAMQVHASPHPLTSMLHSIHSRTQASGGFGWFAACCNAGQGPRVRRCH